MTDSNRPRHLIDNSADDFPENHGVDEEFIPPARPESTGGQELAGASAALSQEQAAQAPGLPLRGFAMILIAVAVLLIIWGAFSLMGDKDEVAGGEGGVVNSQEQPQKQQPANPPAAPSSPAEEPADKLADKSAEKPDDKPAEKPDDKPAEVVRGETHVTVLNNSPIQGLAGTTADQLKGEQWQATSVGNLPDSAYTFRESAVFYPAGDPTAKAAAEQIARQLGITAQERTGAIDEAMRGAQMLDGPAPGGIIVVTTNDLQ